MIYTNKVIHTIFTALLLFCTFCVVIIYRKIHIQGLSLVACDLGGPKLTKIILFAIFIQPPYSYSGTSVTDTMQGYRKVDARVTCLRTFKSIFTHNRFVGIK